MMGLQVRKVIDPFTVRKEHRLKLYELFVEYWSDEGHDLVSSGYDLEELIDNAELWWPEGNKPAGTPALDEATAFITEWYIEQRRLRTAQNPSDSECAGERE